MGLTLWYLCQIILIDISSNTMINTKLILAGVLVTIFLLSFDSVESDCNCEGPVVDHCCPVGFNGNCCEFPLRRSENRLDEHSPLALKLKKEAQAWPEGCYDCFHGGMICCKFGNGTQSCAFAKNCPTYVDENGISTVKKDVPESRANKRKSKCQPKLAFCTRHVQCCSRRCRAFKC